nr:MAG TPA: hypothetical protein [Caudoviricetes sp.]
MLYNSYYIAKSVKNLCCTNLIYEKCCRKNFSQIWFTGHVGYMCINIVWESAYARI